MNTTDTSTFATFFAEAEPKLRPALIARYGGELGRDATAEALAYGWQHWDRVAEMDNPVGYLYRVGERWGRRQRPKQAIGTADAAAGPELEFEPGLAPALAALSVRQRQVVVLTTGYGLTHAETADLLGIRRSSVQNHAERGLKRLRDHLGVHA